MIGWLRVTFIDNFGTWIMSLVLAAGIWGYLVTETVDEVTIIVPVQYRSTPEWVVEGEQLPEMIEVTLRGPKGLLESADLKSVACVPTINWSKEMQSPVRVQLNDSSFSNLPGDLKVILPTELRVSFDTYAETKLKVAPPVLEGEPAPGFVVEGDPVVSPQEVSVRIRRSVLERLENGVVPIQTVKITNRAEEVIDPARPVNEKDIRFLEPVQVRVNIVVRKVRRKVTVPIQIMTAPNLTSASFEIESPDTCEVVIEGKDLPENIRADQVEAYVRITRNITPGDDQFQEKVRARVNLEGARVVQWTPTEVNVKTRLE